MAKSKKFDEIQGGDITAMISDSGRTYTKAAPASPEEQEQRKATRRTQGRTGCKMQRLNTTFTPENYRYVKTMGRLFAGSIGSFLDTIIEQHRAEHMEEYEEAQKLILRIDPDFYNE